MAVLAAAVTLGVTACAPAPTDDETASAADPTPTPSSSMVLPPGGEGDADEGDANSDEGDAKSGEGDAKPDESEAPPAEDGPVEPAPLPTAKAELGDTVAFDTGIDVEIVSVQAIDVKAETPGEVSGSALAVKVAARNSSTQTQSVDSAVVTVVADGGEVGIGTTAGEPSPLAGDVEPGESTTGTYVFMLTPATDRKVRVSVNYAAGEPVAVFTGKTS